MNEHFQAEELFMPYEMRITSSFNAASCSRQCYAATANMQLSKYSLLCSGGAGWHDMPLAAKLGVSTILTTNYPVSCDVQLLHTNGS
jgi:hypothetical protein